MIEYVIYGKTIIDNIRLLDGTLARGVLGGGGPQAAFGARLWNDHVGFLTRYGADIPQDALAMLNELDIDLTGNVRYADLPTLRGGLAYNDAQHLIASTFEEMDSNLRQSVWDGMLSRAIPLPEEYRKARAIHLITEYWTEPMVRDALAMKAHGAIFSLEPLVGWGDWSRGEPLKEVLPHVDIVTPDFPAASHLAGSDDPLTVIKYWSKLGSRAVAVRNAQYGSYVWDCDHDEIWHIPIIPVHVVDPTGAGNSYGGGWCVGWTEKREARLAGCYGAVSASFLVERVGLSPMTPELRDEAQSRLEQALENVKRL